MHACLPAFPRVSHTPGLRVLHLHGQHPARRRQLPPEAFYVLRAFLPGLSVRPAPYRQGMPRVL